MAAYPSAVYTPDIQRNTKLYKFSAYLYNSLKFQKEHYLDMIIYESAQDPVDILYNKYIQECVYTRDFTVFREAELDEGIKEVWNFIKEIASSAALKISDLVRALKNKGIFTFFASFGFNPKKVAEAFKGVYEFTKKITHFIPGTIAKIIQKGYDAIPPEQKKLVIDGVNALDKWIRSKGKFGNVIFACFLVWIWLSADLTGDILYDFDMAEPLNALRGKLTVAEFFLGDNGNGTNRNGDPVLALEYLGLIISGKIGIGGILPYAQFSNALFVTVSLLQYLAKEVGIRLTKGRNSDTDLDKAQATFA
jgi:hypothetical protein